MSQTFAVKPQGHRRTPPQCAAGSLFVKAQSLQALHRAIHAYSIRDKNERLFACEQIFYVLFLVRSGL